MKFNTELLIDTMDTRDMLLDLMINHFNYSMKDIDSWDELTDEEKVIIPREVFDSLMVKS